ncbi:MAG TPA: ABC transporter permease [Candidatus Angelobacter sp.]
MMSTFWHDLRYGLRLLLKNPGFAGAAIVCLALGIGATTAIFSVVNAVLLRPLPYAQPERLIKVYSEFPNQSSGRRFWISPPEYIDLKRDTKSWESLDAWVNNGVNLGGKMEPVRITASFVTGGLLRSLGVTPALGRVITPEDDDPRANTVVDISYGVWQRVFAGDPNIVGKEALLNGRKCTIIGVMPDGFVFPPGEIPVPEAWSALQIDPARPGNRGSHYLYLLGRLKQNVSAQQAQSELESLVRYWGGKASAREHSLDPQNHTLVSFPFQSEVVSNVRLALAVLMGAVVFVLLIACVNVANLLLARAEARQREVAIRSALGASFGRLLRQFIAEGVLLSFFGALLGVGLAFAALKLITVGNAGKIPRADEIAIDWHVLLVALAVSILTGVAFGLAPAFHLAIRNVFVLLKDAAGWSTSTLSAQNFRRVLVAVEISLAVVLLIGCGLMLRAFWKLQQVHVVPDPQTLITMRVSLPTATYNDNLKIEQFWSRLKERVSQLPGVQVSFSSGLPPLRQKDVNTTDIEGFVQKKGGPTPEIDFYNDVSEGYFETMGIPLVEGRYFTSADTEGSQPVVIINQTMARMYWGNESAIGHHLRADNRDPWNTIVGVVGDVKNAGIDLPAGTELYFPFRQKEGYGDSTGSWSLRSSLAPSVIAGSVRRELHDLEPAAAISQGRTMEEMIYSSQSRPRLLTLLLSIFSLVALVLAAIGIYGLLSYLVAQRGKEFGLRMALGAPRPHVLGLVLKQGAWLAITGVLAGLGAAIALTRLMATLLFEVRATDPLTFLVMPALLAGVALTASYIPARRATRVDPMVALRYE